MITTTYLLLGVGYDGTISFWEGVILLVSFFVYLGYLFLMVKKDSDKVQEY